MIIIYLSFIMLVGCGSARNNGLKKSFNELVKDKSYREINIATLTDFDWDKGFLFHPYFAHADIHSLLGVDFKEHRNIESRDDIYFLVFLYEDKVIQYAELKREQSSFSIGEKRLHYS